MTNYKKIINALEDNGASFKSLLLGISKEEQFWKPEPGKWCLLEIVCHLYDEEREDFRARVKHVLETPGEPMPSINPQEWVKSRKYMEQDFESTIKKFLEERRKSVEWLNSLREPKWEGFYQHPKIGPMTAKMLLSNWLAHDYLHFRQITRLKYQHLKSMSGEPLDYAGEW